VTVSISSVRDAAYYESYAALGGPAPRWLGSAVLADLGIDRAVRVGTHDSDVDANRPGDLTFLLEGRHPDTGQRIKKRKDSPGHRPGYDLTFSPPKSVSVLAALSDDHDLADALWAAHRAAVDKTFAWMEDELFRSRRGHAGRDGVVEGRVVAVAFDHATSRLDDPQMHTHVVLANLHWGIDGRIGSLDGDRFWSGRKARERVVKALSRVYESELRCEVTERTGLAWTRPQGKDGHRELRGVPEAIIREFSRRSDAISQALEATGIGDSHGARLAATLDTRTAKSERLASELMPEWRRRVARHGLDGHALTARVRRASRRRAVRSDDQQAGHRHPEPERPDPDDVLRLLHGPGGGSTWTRRDLLGGLAVLTPAGASLEELERMADAMLADDALVTRVSDPVAMDRGQEPRFAATRLLAAEVGITEIAATVTRPGVQQSVVDSTIKKSSLDPEQEQAVRALLADGSLVRLLVAPPGAGKTFTLGRAAEAWREGGRRVCGLSTSWRAANEMVDAGVASVGDAAAFAFARWSEQGLEHWVPKNGVVVVDEASMMATADIAQVVRLARDRNATVVLVGDPRQLGSVEAGGLFAMLIEHLPHTELAENRRQAEAWAVRAIDDVRHGRSLPAVAAWAQHGDLLVFDRPEQAASALLDEWLAERRRGTEVAILSSTVAGRQALNRLAQERALQAGLISKRGVRLPASTKRDDIDERVVHVGDVVRFRKHRSLWPGKLRCEVSNGTTGTVVEAWREHLVVDVRGVKLKVTTDWARDWVDLGYASTIHAAQGQTVGTSRAARERTGKGRRGVVLVLGPESLGLEAATVAASRAVDSTKCFAWTEPDHEPTGPHLLDREGRPIEPDERDPLESAEQRWAEPGADRSGVTEFERVEDIRELMRLGWDTLEAQLEETRTRLDEARSGASNEDAVELAEQVSKLDEALHGVRQREITRALLEVPRADSELGTALGPLPPDRGGQLLYKQVVGNVLDAERWVRAARRKSESPRIQAAADDARDDVLKLLKASSDLRRLDELVDQETVERLREQVAECLPEECHAALRTFAAERVLIAGAWAGIDPAMVGAHACELLEVGAEPERAVPTALRQELGGAILDARREGKVVPLSVLAAAEAGFTIPAVAAVVEAREALEALEARRRQEEARGRARERTQEPEPKQEQEPASTPEPATTTTRRSEPTEKKEGAYEYEFEDDEALRLTARHRANERGRER